MAAVAGPADPPSSAPDIRSGRLDAPQYAAGFADGAPRLSRTQALVEAERCLYCFDAPCTEACPTGIDVPTFIRRIGDGNLRGAARAILEANPLGGTCARACPTEELCEQACVRMTQQGKPVEIGRLQRYAVDAVMEQSITALFARAAPSRRRIAVVGAGPAGVACAFELARRGHEVVIHDARPRGGGLNEYGLATYKMADDFAQRELAWLMQIGGIRLELGWRLTGASQLDPLRRDFDAVFLAVGLARVNALAVEGEHLDGVRDAIDFIADLRTAPEKASLPIGRRVVVIGGGMTAIDAAVQSRLLGASEVRIVYRREAAQMSASLAEQQRALTCGVTIHHALRPLEVIGRDGHVSAVRFAARDGTEAVFDADMVFKAIGQRLDPGPWEQAGLVLDGGRIAAGADGATAVAGLWVGGDCRAGGRDLTVQAVEDGKRAAQSIHAWLQGLGA
jgi:dihydropyrimidine dehydrogenase (NAD+) subunit PreT